MKSLLQYVAVLIVYSIFIHSCGTSADSEKDTNVRPDFDEIAIVEPAEILRVFDFNDGQFFGNVTTVYSGAGETILVSDIGAKKIYLFDENGAYRDFLGGDGEGPGEFRQLGITGLIAPDTLMALDWQLARITLIGYDPESETWSSSRFLDRPAGNFEYGDNMFFTFRGLHPHENGYIGMFNSSFTPVDTATYSHGYFTRLDYNLNPLSGTMYRPHVLTKPLLIREGDGIMVGGVPENHRLEFYITGDGRFISTWSGSRTLKIEHITGDEDRSFEFYSSHEAISSARKRETAVEHIPNPDQAMFTREQIIDRMPDYFGYSRSVISDDQNRIWIRVRPAEEDDPEWLVYNEDGSLLFAVHHPGGTFHQIRNNRIYASITSENDEPGFGVFEIPVIVEAYD